MDKRFIFIGDLDIYMSSGNYRELKGYFGCLEDSEIVDDLSIGSFHNIENVILLMGRISDYNKFKSVLPGIKDYFKLHSTIYNLETGVLES